MEIDDPMDAPIPRSTLLPIPEERNPFSVLNNFPGFLDPMMGPIARDFFARGPRVSQPRVSREIPIEVKDDNSHVQGGSSDTGPAIEEVTDDMPPQHGPEIHPAVIVDEDDDVVNMDGGNDRFHHVDPAPSAPIVADVTDYNNDIEEQMIQAAIEASKRDALGHSEEVFDACFLFQFIFFSLLCTYHYIELNWCIIGVYNQLFLLSNVDLLHLQRPADHSDIARAVSLSMQVLFCLSLPKFVFFFSRDILCSYPEKTMKSVVTLQKKMFIRETCIRLKSLNTYYYYHFFQ
jgi:hypothetical protein